MFASSVNGVSHAAADVPDIVLVAMTLGIAGVELREGVLPERAPIGDGRLVRYGLFGGISDGLVALSVSLDDREVLAAHLEGGRDGLRLEIAGILIEAVEPDVERVAVAGVLVPASRQIKTDRTDGRAPQAAEAAHLDFRVGLEVPPAVRMSLRPCRKKPVKTGLARG